MFLHFSLSDLQQWLTASTHFIQIGSNSPGFLQYWGNCLIRNFGNRQIHIRYDYSNPLPIWVRVNKIIYTAGANRQNGLISEKQTLLHNCVYVQYSD